MAALIVAAVLILFALFVAARTVRIIPQARAGVVERLGRYHRTLTPGLAIVVPFVDRVKPLIDLREQVVTFPPQPVITQDNVSVGIDTVLYFTVTDPKAASYEIANPLQAIEQLTVTTLRNIIGSLTLEETLTSRDQVNDRLRDRARRAHRPLGHPDQRRGAQVDRSADDDPGGDGEADARRARPARDDPHRRGRQAVADPHRRGREAVGGAQGRGRQAVGDPARRGRVQGDRDRLRGHPRGQARPRAAQLPVPADAAAHRRRATPTRCGSSRPSSRRRCPACRAPSAAVARSPRPRRSPSPRRSRRRRRD